MRKNKNKEIFLTKFKIKEIWNHIDKHNKLIIKTKFLIKMNPI